MSKVYNNYEKSLISLGKIKHLCGLSRAASSFIITLC